MQDATKRWLTEAERKAIHNLTEYGDLRYIGDALQAIDRLCADLDKQQCANPDATTCAKQWEADHQRAALEHHGLADEFPYGPDAIEHVAAALVDARARLDKQQEVIDKLPKLADDVPVVPTMRVYHYRHPDGVYHALAVPGKGSNIPIGRGQYLRCDECYSTKEAAAAARAGEGRG